MGREMDGYLLSSDNIPLCSFLSRIHIIKYNNYSLAVQEHKIQIKWEAEQQSTYARAKYHRANWISTTTQLSFCLAEICFKIESIQQD